MRSLRSQQGACVRATLLASKGRALHRSGLLAVWWTKVLANMAEYPQTGISIQPRRCRATTLPRFRRRLPRPTRTPRPRTRSRLVLLPLLLLLLSSSTTTVVTIESSGASDYGYDRGLAGPTWRKDVMRGVFARSLPPSYHRRDLTATRIYLPSPLFASTKTNHAPLKHQRSGPLLLVSAACPAFRLTVSASRPLERSPSLSPRIQYALVAHKRLCSLLNAQE